MKITYTSHKRLLLFTFLTITFLLIFPPFSLCIGNADSETDFKAEKLPFCADSDLPHQYKVLKPWQVEGIKSAMEDSDPEVWMLGWNKIGEWIYESKNEALRVDGRKLQAELRKIAVRHGKIFEKELRTISKFDRSSINRLTVKAMGNLGEPAKAHVDLLLEMLNSEHLEGKEIVMDAIAKSGKYSGKYTEVIAKSVRYQCGYARYPSLNAALKTGAPPELIAPPLAERLGFINGDFRDFADDNFIKMAGDPAYDMVPLCKILLKNPEPDVRKLSLIALRNMGERAKDASPEIAELLKDPKPMIRYFALSTLGNTKSGAVKFIPQILEMLKDKNPVIVVGALDALGNMGTLAGDYTEVIAGYFDHKDYRVRAIAVEAMGKIGKNGFKFKKQISEMLRDKEVDTPVRTRAMLSLGQMGEEAVEYIPCMISYFDEYKKIEDERIKAANESYRKKEWKIDYQMKKDSGSIPISKSPSYLFNSDLDESGLSIYEYMLPEQILDLLIGMGKNHAETYPAIIDFALKYKCDMPRVQYMEDYDTGSCKIVGQMLQSTEAGPKIRKMLESKDSSDRKYILYLLLLTHSLAMQYEQEIIGMLDDKEPDIRILGAMTLLELQGDTEKYNNDIAPLIIDKDDEVRSFALKALLQKDRKYQEYVPVLAKGLKVKDYWAVDERKYEILLQAGPLDHLSVLPILEQNRLESDKTVSEIRFLAHYLAGNDAKARVVIRWLGHPLKYPDPSKISREEALMTLGVFDEIWLPSRGTEKLHWELISQAVNIIKVKKGEWKAEDKALLEQFAHYLKRENKTKYMNGVEEVIDGIAGGKSGV